MRIDRRPIEFSNERVSSLSTFRDRLLEKHGTFALPELYIYARNALVTIKNGTLAFARTSSTHVQGAKPRNTVTRCMGYFHAEYLRYIALH